MITLMTNAVEQIEDLFKGLLYICISSFMQCLFKRFVDYSVGLSVLSLIYRISLYSAKNLSIVVCIVIFFSMLWLTFSLSLWYPSVNNHALF